MPSSGDEEESEDDNNSIASEGNEEQNDNGEASEVFRAELSDGEYDCTFDDLHYDSNVLLTGEADWQSFRIPVGLLRHEDKLAIQNRAAGICLWRVGSGVAFVPALQRRLPRTGLQQRRATKGRVVLSAAPRRRLVGAVASGAAFVRALRPAASRSSGAGVFEMASRSVFEETFLSVSKSATSKR
ncbi:hypothetical protein PR002_g12078 [Phytophthora rubi]|uniref:Uncharacterized protein n=1 Tax=Phytophthora rubi TaxID=129364 RepID=A0A6A3LRR6_9STRA|nr:hypothetical protein PR002_g12078 [Phytophthora rubi]